VNRNDLAACIVELRDRLRRGDLPPGPLLLGDGRVLQDVEHAVWLLLKDVDRYRQMLAAERQTPAHRTQRRQLAETLLRLREVLTGRPPLSNGPLLRGPLR
jgi:hypothetical protein